MPVVVSVVLVPVVSVVLVPVVSVELVPVVLVVCGRFTFVHVVLFT